VRLNAFCGREAFDAVAGMRDRARRALQGRTGASKLVWKRVLGRCTVAGVTQADEKDLRLASSIGPGALQGGPPLTAPDPSPASDDASGWTAALSSPGVNLRPGPESGDRTNYRAAVRTDVKIDLTGRCMDIPKVDYFRLYLYLWEDIPDDHTRSVTLMTQVSYFPPLCFTHSNNSTSIHQQSTEQHQSLNAPLSYSCPLPAFGVPSPFECGKRERAFSTLNFPFTPSPFFNSQWERGPGGEVEEPHQSSGLPAALVYADYIMRYCHRRVSV